VDGFGWGHAERYHDDLGHLQRARLGDQRVHGDRDGDLSYRYDEIGDLADYGQRSARHHDNFSSRGDCGGRLQPETERVGRNQSV